MKNADVKEARSVKKKIKVVEPLYSMACDNGQLRDGKGNKSGEC